MNALSASAAVPRDFHFLVPGDWDLPTGGYTYDRRMAYALRDAGHPITAHSLTGSWPYPSAAELAAADKTLTQLPDHCVVVADGLAFGAMATVAAAHAHRLRWVALVHHPLHLETGLTPAQKLYLLSAETQALQHARRVVVTSTATASDVVAMGVPAAHVRVVEPGTDRVLMPARRHQRSGPLTLLCVATLTPRKGHSLLLRALADLAHLNWELHNVGSATRDPATAAALRAQAAPMAQKVFWHGELDAQKLSAYFAAADVFVLASLHEGFGMVVTEALAHGLPVVASNAGALAQTLPQGAGLSVAAGDVSALRFALEQVMGDERVRESLAAGARAAAANLPSWPQQADRLMVALTDLQNHQ